MSFANYRDTMFRLEACNEARWPRCNLHADLKNRPLTVLPSDASEYGEYLKLVYEELKAADGKYSYKKFAESLGVGAPSNLHNIINGKRSLSLKVATKIISGLGLKGDQKELFLLYVKIKLTKKANERETLVEKILQVRKRLGSTITDDQFELCKDWYHLVIRELLSIPNISQAPADIANLVVPKLRPVQVEKSIALLLRLGMVAYNIRSGRLEPTDEHIKTGAETEGLLVVKYHQSMLDISKNAIDAVSEEARDISANTIKVTASQITKIKRKIYDLQMEVMAEEPEGPDADQVYQLNFQFFPISESFANHNEDEGCDDETQKSA